MAAPKLTRTMKKEITKQWQAEFPSMGIYKNMWLMNIVGPIIVGLLLEVKSINSEYYPTLHLDILTRERNEDDDIALTASTEVDFEYVSTISKPDKYLVLADKLKKKAVIPLEGDVKIEEVINCLKKYCSQKYYKVDWMYTLKLMMHLAVWSNREDIIDDTFKFVKNRLQYLVHVEWLRNKQEADQWYKEILDDIADADLLKQRVEENIVKLKLTDIPVRKIIL